MVISPLELLHAGTSHHQFAVQADAGEDARVVVSTITLRAPRLRLALAEVTDWRVPDARYYECLYLCAALLYGRFVFRH